ncbi:MAG: hypothetical protein Tsb002_27920 [Wenzhouxiangellaceae bacterium]
MYNQQIQDLNLTNDVENLDDETLQSISGGCTGSCGGFSIVINSCTAPGIICP